MKGVVFTEFLEMVEEAYSADLVDDIIETADLPSGGAYTAVGTYSHVEMVKLVSELSERTDITVGELLALFGRHLMGRFEALYPEFFEGIDGTFSFLETLEDHIHKEVKKLYPEAELPTFEYAYPADGIMTLEYRSNRPFADLAGGLINACADRWGESIAVEREDLPGEAGTHALFTLIRK